MPPSCRFAPLPDLTSEAAIDAFRPFCDIPRLGCNREVMLEQRTLPGSQTGQTSALGDGRGRATKLFIENLAISAGRCQGLKVVTTSEERRLAAIFVADVVGYSGLMELDETTTATAGSRPSAEQEIVMLSWDDLAGALLLPSRHRSPSALMICGNHRSIAAGAPLNQPSCCQVGQASPPRPCNRIDSPLANP